jgi:hypothetical protein
MHDKSADGRRRGLPPPPTRMSVLGHDPENWIPAFRKRSCSNNKLGRDDDAKKSHPALRIGSAPALVVAAGLLLGACSSGSDSSFSLFAEPGKYEYYSCDQIAGQIKSWSQKEQELKTLMDRADQSAGGTAVGIIAYKADYVAAGEELDQLKATAHSKKCDQAASWRSDGAIQ